MALANEVSFEPLEALHADPQNPRLRQHDREWENEDDLLKYLAENWDAIVLAESIARHGYFGSEPLVITSEGGVWIVLEGNRRLAALSGLARPELRATFHDADRWEAAADSVPQARAITLNTDVPVLVAETRED